MTDRAIDLYDRISVLDLALGDILDDIPADALRAGDAADLRQALEHVERAVVAIERVRSRYSAWLPAKED